MSVAVEQQALARVHRFGQKREVRIIRFITEHTVEVRPLLSMLLPFSRESPSSFHLASGALQ